MLAHAMLLLSFALLPYLTGGMRLEHIMIPALAIWAVLTARRVHAETPWLVGGLMVGAFAAAFFSRYSFETGTMAEPISQFIRLILPALAMVAFPTVLPQSKDATLYMAMATVILGVVVALFTAASLISAAAGELLGLWVRAAEGGTWLNSQDVGRYTGIFNQPIEAGVFYSVALISAVHLLRYSKASRIFLIVSILIIIGGGSASLSKNFIVLGAAAAIGYAFMTRLVSRTVAIFLSIPIIISIPIALERFNIAYIGSLTDLYYDGGLLSALSAGRFGSDEGSVSILFQSLLASGDWLTGRGLGSQLPLDSGYLEYLYQGGIVALAGYLVTMAGLTVYAWANRQHRDGKLLAVLMGYIWLAAAGGPTITANRAGVAVMLLVSACLVSIRHSRVRNAAGTPPTPELARAGWA